MRMRLVALVGGGLLSLVSIWTATMGLLSFRPTVCDVVGQVPGLACGSLIESASGTAIVVACMFLAGTVASILGRRSRQRRMRSWLEVGEPANLGRAWHVMSVVQTLCTISAVSLFLVLTATTDVPVSSQPTAMTGALVVALVTGLLAAFVLTNRRADRVEQREYARAGWESVPKHSGATTSSGSRVPMASSLDEPVECTCPTTGYCSQHGWKGVDKTSTSPNQPG